MKSNNSSTNSQFYTNKNLPSFMRNINNLISQGQHDAAVNELNKEVSELLAANKITQENARELYTECAYNLLKKRDSGWAKDILDKLAEYYASSGLINESASVYSDFADKLFDCGEFGWAGSRYYDAATLYIEQADLKIALTILRHAIERFLTIPYGDEYWTKWLSKHVKLIANSIEEITHDEAISLKKYIDIVAVLRSDFVSMDRYEWIKRCDNGIRKLFDLKVALSNSNCTICDEATMD